MVNRVLLIGNLGRDPEVRRLDNGAVVAKFPIATSESYRDKNGEWQTNTEWHDIVVWRALAERAESSLKKGALIYLEGKLTHRTWQDQDGNTRYVTEVAGSYFRIIDKQAPGVASAVAEPAMARTGDDAEEPPPANEEANDANDDLPF
jgi:single-strand DNA-binding protein